MYKNKFSNHLFHLPIKSKSEKEIKRIMPIVKKIEALAPEMEALSDEELQDKTDYFKEQLSKGKTLDDILPEAFAVCREAARRVLGLYPFEVQIIAGIFLHQGRLAEQKTGEGKTLTAALPTYLNALAGKGVQVVTVNDYLAKRDADEIGKIHKFLGLSVGCIVHDMEKPERKKQYACDVTYVTNNELGFDYLKDNMAFSEEELMIRDFDYCIIDEVDSVLIDEARTPLIISGKEKETSEIFHKCNELALEMEKGELKDFSKLDAIIGVIEEEDGDFVADEKEKRIILTAQGVKKIEERFGIDNFADTENLQIQRDIMLALRSNYLLKRDVDYMVKDNEVLLIDEFTGRVQPGRRFSDGLHQALEAKEGVTVKAENQTLAMVTFQSFFNKYRKKAGMTGTAKTEEKEFQEIFGLDVIEVPTNKPVIRVDHEDAVFKSKDEKYRAVVNEVVETHKKGQPVLVGTTSVEVSELISEMIKKEGIKHSVLNAKHHEKEAHIVEKAGQFGAVTIATNMAGRGTDIKLDDKAREAGGLKIIGTERHEARRIDNQLRGRSGRQGDPGESRFYISFEDDLLRLFGSDKAKKAVEAMGVQDGEQIEHKTLSKTIENAQKMIEEMHFSQRKTLLEYDQVMNEQRELIYGERLRTLKSDNLKESIIGMIKTTVDGFSDKPLEFCQQLAETFGGNITPPVEKFMDEFRENVKNELIAEYDRREVLFGEQNMRNVEKYVLLGTVDFEWQNHMDDMEVLKAGIGLRSYGQKDPRIEYRMVGFEMFDEMQIRIQKQALKTLFAMKPLYQPTLIKPEEAPEQV